MRLFSFAHRRVWQRNPVVLSSYEWSERYVAGDEWSRRHPGAEVSAVTPRVSVVIPTLNARQTIEALLGSLTNQTLLPSEVLVIDSSSDDGTLEIVGRHPGTDTVVIARNEFNHGLTRHEGVLRTSGEIVCFLTQDALPMKPDYLEQLTLPFRNSNVGMSSGRQVAQPNARRFEQLVRDFNYGDQSFIRTIDDIPRLGIKTFFASDVCSAYRRTAYLRCGGFTACETNEDMLMAAKMIREGLAVAYAAEALVLHSHAMSLTQQFARNRLVGRFLEENEDMLSGPQEIGEGRRMVRVVATQLLRERDAKEVVAFGADCTARLLGSRFGRLDVRRRTRRGSVL